MNLIRSLVYIVFQAITLIPIGLIEIIIAPFIPFRWRYDFTVLWPRMALWGARTILGIQWQLKGQENLPDGPCILLSKHQSAWETIFYIAQFRKYPLCYVFKKELLIIPFFGWGIGLLRMIHIDRKKGIDAFDSILRQGKQRLSEGRWMIFFPEGTRTPVGSKGRYKSGGARLAVHAQVPAVPIAMNAGECWPRNAFVKKPGLVTVSIGPAIDPKALSADQLNSKVEEWIETEMRRISPKVYPANDPLLQKVQAE